MQIENLPLNKIIPYVRNPRKNNAAIDGVASSIKEFGFQNPIIIDSNDVIVAGHTRHAAAKKLGLETVPCVRAEHPTIKPIALPVNAMLNNSDEGDAVFDLFLGSGTTLIACERLKRTCYGMELEPRYVDVICQRFYNETKQVPVRENDQTPFPVEVADG